ncbi:MAG: OsmC family protein [Chloroflexi bacterium]|nr:OsmC family protein [Chloroflexota bacterium]
MKIVTIDWDPARERFVAEGTHRGHRVDINAPHTLPEGEGRHGPSGFSASELLLAGAGSCAAWDLVEILRKQRQDLRDLQVEVEGEQQADPPWPYQRIHMRFRVTGVALDEGRVRRAVELSVDRYCSVISTLRGVATVTSQVVIVEHPAAETSVGAPVTV